MLKTILARLHQKHRTMKYPDEAPVLPELFRGYPRLMPENCPEECGECVAACPFGAIETGKRGQRAGDRKGVGLMLDTGKCIFCRECALSCPHGAIEFTTDHRLATSRREELIVAPSEGHPLARALEGKLLRLYGRSLKLREVSAGGCNACEADTNVLATVGFDLGRFGIQFVASPRHADGIFITGPVSSNMREALLKTWEAIPEPRIAIACGACAIGGGPFRGNPEINDGVGDLIPIDLYIPGCPPHPLTILDGLLRLLGR
ncbi:MAG TPA: 4Fe-4S dicluster domain-containing protein, partial [Geobacteraceae bacterium]|nr:4Fe-4S dicluster domain-containing protein [Geobacteraceae bacterium]